MVLIKDLGTRPVGKTKIFMRRFGLYECPTCKTHFEVLTNSVNSGNTKGCNDCSKLKHKKENSVSKTKVYHILNGMKQRCYNKKSKPYKDYGGRGIVICQEWKNSYLSFIDWAMVNGYKEGMSIDRINNDGNYEPSNCRWVNNTVQSRNSRLIRSSNSSGYRGVCFDKSRNKFISTIGIGGKLKNLGRFDTAEEACYAYDEYVIKNNLEHTINKPCKRVNYAM